MPLFFVNNIKRIVFIFFISAALQRRSQPAVEDKETRPAPSNTRNLRMSVDYINKKKRFDNMTQLI